MGKEFVSIPLQAHQSISTIVRVTFAQLLLRSAGGAVGEQDNHLSTVPNPDTLWNFSSMMFRLLLTVNRFSRRPDKHRNGGPRRSCYIVIAAHYPGAK